MHQNLSIVNPLLQVMESGFKHGNNDVKSITYECWTSLILNFALDRGNKSFFNDNYMQCHKFNYFLK